MNIIELILIINKYDLHKNEKYDISNDIYFYKFRIYFNHISMNM